MESEANGAGLLDDYLTPDQLAEELGKSVRTIARWDGLRIGPPKTVIGKKSYYRREGVRQWLLRKEQEQVRASSGSEPARGKAT